MKPNGKYDHIGEYGYWWFKSPYTDRLIYNYLSYCNNKIEGKYGDLGYGFSVRCLSDINEPLKIYR